MDGVGLRVLDNDGLTAISTGDRRMTELTRTAVVTGGNTGIGAAIARGLIERGYLVVSLSRRRPDWRHDRLRDVEVDLTDAAATRQAAREIAAASKSRPWSTMPAPSAPVCSRPSIRRISTR